MHMRLTVLKHILLEAAVEYLFADTEMTCIGAPPDALFPPASIVQGAPPCFTSTALMWH